MRVVDAQGNTLRDEETASATAAWNTPQVFERGDKVYLTAPVQLFTPTDDQIEELAFAKDLKQLAPNEHIMWLRGQYVEADHPNKNGAQWRAGELAMKQLTPMLMPITVMHDPRTAVGTIADVKLRLPEKEADIPRPRLDTILALWAHRFPEVAREAELNAERGTLMQSMECFSPWYECSECGRTYQKLPRGAEQAMWCDHLKASNPSAGYVARSQSSNASRILGDVCFTGTGLIFGTRGAVGAYNEAHLEVFQEEVASHHQQAHTETASGRTHKMTLVQIEDSELAQLRKERDDAKAEVTAKADEAAQKQRDLEAAEAAKATAEQAAKDEKEAREKLEAEKAGGELATKRFEAFGTAFKAKVESLPSVKASLTEQAKTMDEDQWNARLTEVEELSGVKRDATADNGGGGGDNGEKDAATLAAEREAAKAGPTFSQEEVAKLDLGGGGQQSSQVTDRDRQAVVGKLAGVFSPPKEKAGAAS